MCKILAFTETKKLNIKKSINFIGNALLKLERDGFGYAIRGAKGIYGEKSVAKSFGTRFFTNNQVKLDIVKKQYEMFGEVSPPAGPSIFHGRTSTNVKGLLNCHPMQRDGWNLIHNGVVDDIGPEYTKTTQNDSEDVLHRLIEGFTVSPETPMRSIEATLEGYYAFAAIDPQGRLHVCRDDIASLYVAWSPIYETYIFATTESLLRSVNKSLKAKIGPIDEVKDNIYMIYEGNNLISCQEIKPIGFTTKQSAFAGASLGREIYTPGEGESSILQWQEHHRKSEAGWQNTDKTYSDAYISFLEELEHMDASYTIENEHGIPIDKQQFLKMDHITQELCEVRRGDGTIVDIESHMVPDDERRIG